MDLDAFQDDLTAHLVATAQSGHLRATCHDFDVLNLGAVETMWPGSWSTRTDYFLRGSLPSTRAIRSVGPG